MKIGAKQILSSTATLAQNTYNVTGLGMLKNCVGATAFAMRLWQDNGAAGDRTIDEIRLRPSWDGVNDDFKSTWYLLAGAGNFGAPTNGSYPLTLAVASVAGTPPATAAMALLQMPYNHPCPFSFMQPVIHCPTAGTVDLTKFVLECWPIYGLGFEGDQTLPSLATL